MVKGVSRRVVVVRPQKGDTFEQAIFIVRDGETDGRSAEDILREACSIASGAARRRRKWQALPSLIGAAAGALLVGAAWLLCALLL